MLLSAVITVNAASFKDVKSSDWFYSSVNYVADKGIMQGTSSAKFSPKASLTRAMGVTLLYRVAGSPSVSGINIPFTDVKNGQWYTDAVKWAYKNGIVNGKSATYFATNANITRAEFVTILYRYTAHAGLTVPVTNRGNYPTDLMDIPDWAFAAVNTMCFGDVITGRSDGRFDSNANITRAETAAVIERYTKKATKFTGNSESSGIPSVEAEKIPTSGKLVVKEKKYDYKGGNVMILNIENQTDKDLTLTVSAKYLNSNGGVIKTETRKVEGFPANYRNYVVFEPGIKFDKFTYEIKTSPFNGTAYAKYITYSSKVVARAEPNVFDVNDRRDPIRAGIDFDYTMTNSYLIDLFVTADWVIFDKNGEIFWIENYHGSHIMGADYTRIKTRLLLYDNILWEGFKLPSELEGGCTGIIAFRSVLDYPSI